jgi:hypothetical protein
MRSIPCSLTIRQGGVRNGEYYSLNIFGIPREYMSNNIHFKLKKIL